MSRILSIVDNLRKTEGEFQKIDKTLLLVDHNYQRTKTYDPDKLAQDWSWPSCGTLSVNNRDGKYYVYDGQTRLNAAKKLDWIKMMPCMVYQLGDRVDEAIEWIRSNKHRKGITTLEDYKALLAAEDPLALRTQKLLDEANMKIDLDFRSVGHLMEFLDKDESALMVVWPTLVRLSRNQLMTRDILAGCWFLERNLEDGYSLGDAKVIQRMNQLGYSGLREECNSAARHYKSGTRKNYARGIADAINLKRQLIKHKL